MGRAQADRLAAAAAATKARRVNMGYPSKATGGQGRQIGRARRLTESGWPKWRRKIAPGCGKISSGTQMGDVLRPGNGCGLGKQAQHRVASRSGQHRATAMLWRDQPDIALGLRCQHYGLGGCHQINRAGRRVCRTRHLRRICPPWQQDQHQKQGEKGAEGVHPLSLTDRSGPVEATRPRSAANPITCFHMAVTGAATAKNAGRGWPAAAARSSQPQHWSAAKAACQITRKSAAVRFARLPIVANCTCAPRPDPSASNARLPVA